MHIFLKLIVFITVLVVASMPVNECFADELNDESWSAGAWNELEGRLHDKISLDYFHSNNDVTYSHFSLGNNIEFDLTESFSIYNSIYYKYLWEKYSYQVYDSMSTDGSNKTIRREGRAYGLDDIDAGLKHRVIGGSYGILSHKINVTIPGPYDEDASFTLGNGIYKTDYRILYGYQYSRVYFNLSAGYRWRSGDLTDQLHYSGAIVGKVFQNIRMRIKLDGTFLIKDNYKANNTGSAPSTERVGKKKTGSSVTGDNESDVINKNIYQIRTACGGNGAGFSSDTSLASSTAERRNTLNLTLGMMINLNEDIALDLSYKPSIDSYALEQDISYSAGITYMIL